MTSALVRFTSRPSRWAWLNATVRHYDFDNRTPILEVTDTGSSDGQAPQVATDPETEPLSFTRNIADSSKARSRRSATAPSASATRASTSTGPSGWSSRPPQTLRLAYDVATLDKVTVRADLTRAKRTGSGLDEEVFSDIGEQVSLRQFDIADRTRTQGTLIVTVMPTDLFSLSAWMGGGKDDWPEAQFGLSDTSFSTYAIGADAAPRDGVSMGIHPGDRALRVAAALAPGEPAAEPAVHRPYARLVDRPGGARPHRHGVPRRPERGSPRPKSAAPTTTAGRAPPTPTRWSRTAPW